MMYKIIGADQKEYGPIDTDQIRQWVSEGRVNGQTQACLEGTQEWKPLGMFPEFGSLAGSLAGNLPSAEIGPVPMEEILARDYTIDILGCVSRAWGLFTREFGTVFLTFLLLIGLAFAAGIAMQIILAIVGVKRLSFASQQYIFIPFSLILNALVTGPAAGGLFYVYLRLIRGQPSSPGDLFSGFRSAYSDLFLGRLVTGLVVTACTLPWHISYINRMGSFFDRLQSNPMSIHLPELMSQMISGLVGTLPILLICLVPILYFTVNWQFTLPLIIDKNMGFWTAMKTSWKMVHRHWFHLFALVVIVNLLNVAGAFACCVAVLVTVPIGLAAIAFAYEDIFGRKTA